MQVISLSINPDLCTADISVPTFNINLSEMHPTLLSSQSSSMWTFSLLLPFVTYFDKHLLPIFSYFLLFSWHPLHSFYSLKNFRHPFTSFRRLFLSQFSVLFFIKLSNLRFIILFLLTNKHHLQYMLKYTT